jgi:hypothetical protein
VYAEERNNSHGLIHAGRLRDTARRPCELLRRYGPARLGATVGFSF